MSVVTAQAMRFSREALRRFPSEYRAPTPPPRLALSPPPTTDEPAHPPRGTEIARTLTQLIAEAIRQPDPASYRREAAQRLPDFAKLMDVLVMVATPDAGVSGTHDLFARIDAWGGESRVDELEHGLAIHRRSGALISRFVGVAPADDDRDELLARAWMGHHTAVTWCIMAAALITAMDMLVAPEVVDAVYADLVANAREAYSVAREAYDLRFPPADAEDEG